VNVTINEIVPLVFNVGAYSEEPIAIVDNADFQTKTLTWNANLVAGQTHTYQYMYEAPRVSPDFYQLGFITIQETNQPQIIFRDTKTWQIASDVITNGSNASNLLGQYDQTSLSNPVPIYTLGTANGGTNLLGLSGPYDGVVVDNVHHRLFVGDMGNHRVLVYNLGANDLLLDRIPDYVIGQPNFYTGSATTTQASTQNPYGLAYDSTNDRLFVVQSTARVTVFNLSGGITNGMNASNVL
jgi:hypothetical protein